MSSVPQSRVTFGWIKEFFWSVLVLLLAPVGLFFQEHYRPGRRAQTVILMGDALTSPLVYFRLARRLADEGFPVLTLRSGTIFQDIRQHAARLSEILVRKDIQGGILIGHGMGSLLALGLPDPGRQRLQHLISLGAPFQGTRLFLAFGFIPALRDMAAGSSYLLLHRMNALLFPSFDPFSAWQDQWIFPFNLAHFGQGRDLIFDQVGHYNLVLDHENIDTLVDFLNERYAAPAPPAVAAAPRSLAPPATRATKAAPRKGGANTRSKKKP